MGDAVLEGSERTGARADQAPAQHRIENPATGSTLATVPVLRTGEIAELARRGRRAQTAWREAGFGARTRVFRRAQAWLYARRREVADTIIRETGKTAEDAALEVAVAMQAFGFWARHGPRYLAEERVPGRSRGTGLRCP